MGCENSKEITIGDESSYKQFNLIDKLLVLSKEEYENAKKTSKAQGKAVIFMFSREACGNCQFMGPILHELVTSPENSKSLLYVKIDCDKCNDLCWEDLPKGEKSSLPFIKAYNGNELIGAVCGAEEGGLKDLVTKSKGVLAK